MKVYCAAPIRGSVDKKKFADRIPEIVREMKLSPISEFNIPGNQLTDEEIFTRDISWIEESGCMIAEVSSASTGVGFEIAYSLYHLRKPVLAIYHNDIASTVSAMIKGCTSELLILKNYNDMQEMENIIREFLKLMR